MSTNDPTPTPAPEPAKAAAAAPRKFWMKLMGLKRRPGKRISWGLTRWGMFVVLAFIMMGGMAGFAEYSMQPEFCQSCHIMEPYYQAWHQSTHKGVPCTDCHFLPGLNNTLYGKFQASSQAVKYVTGTYGSKPHAEIQDASCKRKIGSDGKTPCHDTRILEGKGKVDWTVKTERGGEVTIHFDHTPHLTLERRGKQLRCVSCHSQIVQGKHIVVTTDTCFLCHFKGLKHGRDDQTVGTCKGCHDAPSKPIALATGEFNHKNYTDKGVKCENCHSDTVRGGGEVPRQVCWNCHNQTSQIEKYGETQAMHKAHITDHKVECSACHVQIEHSLVAGAREQQLPGARFSTDSGTCGLCHEQTHNGPREMFQGIGGRGVPSTAMPSPMARARVNCIACHMAKENDPNAADVKGQTFVATQDRCDYCHGDKYKNTLADWKKTVDTNTTKADAALLDVKTAFDKSKLTKDVANRELAAARTALIAKLAGSDPAYAAATRKEAAAKNELDAMHARGDATDKIAAGSQLVLDAGAAVNTLETHALAKDDAYQAALKKIQAALAIMNAIDDAEFNIRFVKLAHGVHNPTYATALLNVALDRCRAAQNILNGGPVTP